MARSRFGPSQLTALRNGAIIVGLAVVFSFMDGTLGIASTLITRLVLIAFVAGMAVWGYRYFKENELRWLVIKKPLRIMVIACAVAIAVILLLGEWVLDGVLSPGGQFGLVVLLALVIGWIVAQSNNRY